MSHARFALVVGGTRVGLPLTTWPHGDAPAEPGAAEQWFAWRLLGGNNRELGRSAQVYPSVLGCREAASTVRTRAQEYAAVLVVDARRGMWRWRLDGDHGAVAVSARLYLRQRECQYNLAHFRSGAEHADLWALDDDSAHELADAPLVIDLCEVETTDPAATRGLSDLRRLLAAPAARNQPRPA